MKTIRYSTARIKLRPELDPSEPVVDAKILEGLGRQIQRVEVTSPHRVWRGATLSRDHFKVLEVLD